MYRRPVTFAAVLLAALPALGTANSFENEVEIGAPISAGELTVFPLRPKGTPDNSDYLVLDEAFAAKVLTVHETSRGGSVNSLLVSNSGSKPVYAMAGELLLGGKQDRIIGQSMVIAARSDRVPVPVFCVEHGRWHGGSLAFKSGKALGHTALRKQALFQDQSKVWGEVRATNLSQKTTNDSDTYRKAAQKFEGETAQGAKQILQGFDKVPNTCGFAVAIGGEVTAVEYFAAPALFAKLREKMVASYVAESLRRGRAGPSQPPTAKDVVAFMAEAKNAPQKRAKDSTASKAVDFESDSVAGEQVFDKGRASAVQNSYFKQ